MYINVYIYIYMFTIIYTYIYIYIYIHDDGKSPGCRHEANPRSKGLPD